MKRTTRLHRAWNAWLAAPEWLRLAVMLVALLVICGLAGCASTPVVTRVPIPVACAEKVPDRPAMPTESLAAGVALDTFVQAATAEIERREAHEGELRAALIACTKPLTPD